MLPIKSPPFIVGEIGHKFLRGSLKFALQPFARKLAQPKVMLRLDPDLVLQLDICSGLGLGLRLDNVPWSPKKHVYPAGRKKWAVLGATQKHW